MRRAIHHGAVSRRATPSAPLANSLRNSLQPPMDFAESSAPLEVMLSTAGTFTKGGEASTDSIAERNRHLAVAIMQRNESRLPGRVRNLAVRILADTVVLEGQCATYYTKQLAQHAALGILEDEHLENAIVVSVGQ
jgi:hypothetical protein